MSGSGLLEARLSTGVTSPDLTVVQTPPPAEVPIRREVRYHFACPHGASWWTLGDFATRPTPDRQGSHGGATLRAPPG